VVDAAADGRDAKEVAGQALHEIPLLVNDKVQEHDRIVGIFDGGSAAAAGRAKRRGETGGRRIRGAPAAAATPTAAQGGLP